MIAHDRSSKDRGLGEIATGRALTRDAMWKLLPGIFVYNLIGRYVLWFSGRRFGMPLPVWINLAGMRAIPFARRK